jgi:cobalt/nickel transport system permease protein
MHIPDGYLGPQTYAVLDAAIVPAWAIAAVKVKKTLKAKQVPLMALGAAFSFVIMMFNVPVIGGSTGHAVGAALIAILLGPWAAFISVSIALVIQALLFGDGGITAIGANCINMALIMPFVGFYVYRLVTGDAPTKRRMIVASGIAAYISLVVGAIAAGIEFGLQPLLAHTATGATPASASCRSARGPRGLPFGWWRRQTMGSSPQAPAAVPHEAGGQTAALAVAAFAVLVLLAPIGAWLGDGRARSNELRLLVGCVPADSRRSAAGGRGSSQVTPAFVRTLYSAICCRSHRRLLV